MMLTNENSRLSAPSTQKQGYWIEWRRSGSGVTEIMAADADAAVKEFLRLHSAQGLRPEAVDDREIIGFCENCNETIFSGDHYGMTSDDCRICPKCMLMADSR